MISIQDVSLKIRDGRNKKELFQHLNLDLNEGQKIAIMGKSGSGKTTLLKLIAGLIKADTGNIFFEDKNLRKMSANELSANRLNNIGFIFQNNPMIESKNVFDNIALPLKYLGIEKKIIDQKVQAVSQSLAIEDLLLENPFYLSGGEKQRVGIARALITEPKLILADEPTGSLDAETESMVLNIFQRIELTRTSFIMVTHDFSVANICDEIYTLQDKKLLKK
ncbi:MULTISPECIES: ABC transporter ATP-binding protein [unclassified Enterococcus]|uniref:ABC transporter ATP-binding protein n=1 Tax=unclassified Enterococcus TaxID=2608891 RepID=UPI001A93220F|nr:MULTISPECIES: ABC transporter ATP-binding protein [unclassified Enterococcus]MBO0462482.1 ABC transporter ATP-binding protein [Enterococcus sp. DIV1298c]MBO1301036.1 ABC transporter ATP-binding protein [Enterococcus sp. DIV1271a]